MKTSTWLLASAVWALSACGGGGSETGSTPTVGPTSGSPATGTPITSQPSDCPLFDGTACETFLDGCWAPDQTGTCTDNGLELTWTDGHHITRTGANAGLYGPADGSPCITLDFNMGTLTSTLTNVATGDTLLNQDLGNGNILITCTDGTELTFTVAELEADNVCKGISCP